MGDMSGVKLLTSHYGKYACIDNAGMFMSVIFSIFKIWWLTQR